MSRILMAMTGAIIGIIVLTFIKGFLSDTISEDSYTLNGRFNTSQVDSIRSIDTGNGLEYAFVENESVNVNGNVKLNSSQIDFMSSQGVSVVKTYDGMILGFVDILPFVFLATIIIGCVVNVSGGIGHPASRIYKHKSDPVNNPKYDSTGPIHRNKNYDRIN